MIYSHSNNPSIAEDTSIDVLEDIESPCHLIVWNDDVNTFDWVIETLIQICGHNREQAEQCAILIHYNGKCTVKKDSFNNLKPQCEAIIDRNINATIEDIS